MNSACDYKGFKIYPVECTEEDLNGGLISYRLIVVRRIGYPKILNEFQSFEEAVNWVNERKRGDS